MTTTPKTHFNDTHKSRYTELSLSELMKHRKVIQEKQSNFRTQMITIGGNISILAHLRYNLQPDRYFLVKVKIPQSVVLLSSNGAMIDDSDIAKAVKDQDKEALKEILSAVEQAEKSCADHLAKLVPIFDALVAELMILGNIINSKKEELKSCNS